MKNKIGKILAIMVCAVMATTVLAVAVQAGGNVIFDDQFDDPELGSEWTLSPGRGDYSLTANFGYLRYIIDAQHTGRTGEGGYAKSLWLVCPFSGDQWRLTTAITYDMRPESPTNNRNMHFCIRTPGEGWDWVSIAYIGRSVGVCDYNIGSNHMSLYAGSNGMPIYFSGSTPENCICPLPIERWYFEIERNKDNVTVKASNDGDDSTFEYEREYTFTPGALGNDQVIEINGDGWWGSNSPPGYADFDFIRVVSTSVTEVWVDDDFDSSTSGWQIDHFDSIQDGIDAVSGSTVHVAAGTYTENVVVNKALTVTGQNPPTSTAIIYGSVDITADGVTFENFKVMPTATYTTNEAAIAVYASDVVVNNNIIDGITGDGSGYFTIKGIHVFSSSGISNIDLTNNIIQNVENQGTITAPYGGADGIMIQGVIDGVDVLGNTIEDIHSAGWAYGIEVTPTASDPSNPPQNIVIRENNILSVNDGSVYNVMADPYSAPYPGVGFSLDETDPYAGDGDASGVIVNCNSFVDTPYGAVNKDTSNILDAECNWWDDCTGPYEGILNPGGLGCNVLGLVDFDPWIGITDLSGPTDPVQLGDPANIDFSFTCNEGTATLDWDDENSESLEVNSGSVTHTYSEAGVYTVTLTIEDCCGRSYSREFRYVVVYDPDAGFVTGGGWIYSPEGAYKTNPTLTGKANFGFVSKYKKGQQTPTGNTEFQFKAGDLNFHSDSYDWLLIAGSKAKYKGTGTINGEGSYKFMLSAIDEKLTPSPDDVDMFRIKIWWEDAVGNENIVYDNQPTDPDALDQFEASTVLGGGQIVIHKAK